MKAERITCAEVPDNPALSFSNARRIDNEVVMSGMTARPATPGALTPASAYEQALVTAAGGHKHNLIKVVVCLTDIKDREEFSRARKDFFDAAGVGCYPTSTLVCVSALVSPELKAEVDAWARLDVDLRGSAQ